MERITQAEDPRECSCEERTVYGSKREEVETKRSSCHPVIVGLISYGVVNAVMGNHTVARCDTKVYLTHQME